MRDTTIYIDLEPLFVVCTYALGHSSGGYVYAHSVTQRNTQWGPSFAGKSVERRRHEKSRLVA